MNQDLNTSDLESNLLELHRALPCADVRNRLTLDEYHELLREEIMLFSVLADDIHPKFVFILDEVPDEECVLCNNGIKELDQVSYYGCNRHYVHSCCMQNYFQSGTDAAFHCPCCRRGGMTLYHYQHNVIFVDDMDMEQQQGDNEDDDVIYLGQQQGEDDDDVVYLGMNLGGDNAA